MLWVLYGFSLAFGTDAFHGLVGNLDYFGMRGIGMADCARVQHPGHRRSPPSS